MAAGGHDRLSELPDDLLHRILHFAPLKEAASTTALSRRWRAPLWLSSGALNLEAAMDSNTRFFTRPDDIFTAARVALDAADAPVTRITLRHGTYKDVSRYRYTDLVDVVLSHQAVRRVKELRIIARDPKINYYTAGLYEVTLDSQRFQRLRLLKLHNCEGIVFQSQHAVLPRLCSLGLRRCVQHLGSLQRLIDSAPALAVVRLESVVIDATPEEGKEATARRLSCPTANVLVLDNCTWQKNEEGIYYGQYYFKKTVYVDEINAPRLRRFKYHGSVRSFSFSPQPHELEQVDVYFFKQVSCQYKWNYKKDPNRDLETFWRAARSFTTTRKMRLRVHCLADIAVLSAPRRVELLPAFHRLQHLEVQGVHVEEGKIATETTILNLLRCCPVLCTLRINFTAKNKDTSNKREGVRTQVPQKEIQIAATLGPSHFYQCLQSSLRGVCLQFRLDKSDCIGEKLIKFFAEKAMVLEEMLIDAGDEKLSQDMNTKAEKWNSKRRKLGATSFVLLPLKRRLYQEWKI